ncbi:MAG: bifunctional diaminohydroxyphosphoribosylaminopyrimidine deaminase/5-amino-6-(5-phosphoribosylamino)uracil reductase RibD [Lentisphaerae bacterium]|nr:bifunctional diaminohydroxyphosphoribosylaminopyrimidine deaminase/5-amino-6-(5-phosphoribosylamino)uracil reductase RibD [Lentisphaerota bacterium]MCP4100286.1 bifunctional diaminohydroxyphosphoribosylaminopyrimidine deaminase/5-amino-6-(5-phosphoribosylamino)uracil reductase RibD [Lentisphaerota bacterium]
MVAELDKKYMLEAVALAKKAWGLTSPNPLVGAVIVKDGRIAGTGYHACAGEPHAEINALRNAGEEAENADIYVTLEPCSTHGRTPPCTQAIIDAGIKRVYIGSTDPNPAHAGRGVKILQDAGIEVLTDVEKDACDNLNEAFFKWISTGKPFVILKMAMTLDGKIATATGQSKWITGPAARAHVQRLRKWCDAIIVGGNTLREDRPSLTVREEPPWLRQPLKLIASNSMKNEDLREYFPDDDTARVISADLIEDWDSILNKLGSENITALLVEGGGEFAASVLQAEIVDKVEFHIAPKILGGKNSRPVIGGLDPDNLSLARELSDIKVKRAGEDIIVSGYLNRKK